MRALMIALALFCAMAGCLDAAPATDDAAGTGATPTDPAPPEGALASPFHAQWSGTMAASGGVELPAHFAETSGAAHMVWPDVARDIVVGPDATELIVTLEWTGTGLVQLMANSPIADGAWTEHADPGPMKMSQESPLCVHVSDEDLVEGGWGIMLHTGAAAQLDFTFNVTVFGTAEGPLPDGAAWGTSLPAWLDAHAGGKVEEKTATCG